MFLTTGAFVRGTFTDGLLSANCYLKPTSEFAYLMRLDYGVLQGKTTVFNFRDNFLKVLKYEEGTFTSISKSFESSAEKCNRDIVLNVYGKPAGILSSFMEKTKKLKDKKEKYVGSFALTEKTWYYGNYSNGAPNGLGAMIDSEGKVQIGYFENGQLAGYGRLILPNGIVMDGYISKGTISEDVIVYSQKSHESTEAIFKDSTPVKEKCRYEGYHRENRKKYYAKFFNYEPEKKFNVEIPPEIFSPEIEQELVFYLVYGYKLAGNEGCSNKFEFSFAEQPSSVTPIKKPGLESDRIQYQNDSEADHDKTERTPTQKTNQQPHGSTSYKEDRPRNNQQSNQDSNPEQKPASAARDKSPNLTKPTFLEDKRKSSVAAGTGRNGHQPPNDPLAVSTPGKSVPKKPPTHSESQPPVSHIRSNDAAPNPKRQSSSNQAIRTTGQDAFAAADDNYNLVMDKETPPKPNADHKNPYFKPTQLLQDSANKSKHSQPQFDRYDMLILQRALNWEADKSLNPKNKIVRRTVSNKGIPEETKINIVKNYVEDFMEGFMDRKTIDELMAGVEAYQILKAKPQTN